MTKRNGPIGSAKPGSAAAADAPVITPPSVEKSPEEKAAIAAVSQAPVGAAEPFGVAAPEDVAKNIVADSLVAAAAAAGDPLALGVSGAAEAPASTSPRGEPSDGVERVRGAPDVADQLGGPIPRAPGVAAAAEHLAPPLPGMTADADGIVRQSHLSGGFADQLSGVDPIGDLAGRTFMVRSASDRGRRRAGRQFGPTAIPVDVDDLTAEQLGALLSDSQLFAELLPPEY